mmetsp:Transcript_120301/g.347677  ORF Transcript_120301/g.347677 Transcript_120301/m.347677 type:complete len:232 (-) Transcript_120301:71-766(-)
MLCRRRVRLRLALRSEALRTVQARCHALLDISAQRLHRRSVLEIREPHLQANDIRSSRPRKLIDQAHAGDHVRRLNRGADHSEHKVVPILVNLPAAHIRLELKLEVPAVCVELILPLGPHVLAKDHDCIDDVKPIRLLSHHPFLLEKLTRLRHMVPELPKALDGRKAGHLVRGVGIGRGLVAGLHDLLPNRPLVPQWQILLEHLFVLFGVVRRELQVRVEAVVEAQVCHCC